MVTAPPMPGLTANLDFLPSLNVLLPLSYVVTLPGQKPSLCSCSTQQTQGASPSLGFLGTKAIQINFTVTFNRNQQGMKMCHAYICKARTWTWTWAGKISVCWCPRCSSIHLTFQSASLLQRQMLKDENLKTVLDPKMFQKEAHFFTSPSYQVITKTQFNYLPPIHSKTLLLIFWGCFFPFNINLRGKKASLTNWNIIQLTSFLSVQGHCFLFFTM